MLDIAPVAYRFDRPVPSTGGSYKPLEPARLKAPARSHLLPGAARRCSLVDAADTEPVDAEAVDTPVAQTLRKNTLLAALGGEARGRLAEHLALVPLTVGQVLCESACRQQTAYFPVSAMVSLFYETADGRSTELALIGSEGLAGGSLLLGAESTPHRLVVHASGHALRIRADALKSEFSRGGQLQSTVLRYTQALMMQIGQCAVCNRYHSVLEQVCRRLLSSLDQSNTNEIRVTQESMAQTLGVRRESITEAAGTLQRAGVVECKRGRIRVLDQGRLRSLACECYRVIQREFARLLPTAMHH